jgi:hypothetical protein
LPMQMATSTSPELFRTRVSVPRPSTRRATSRVRLVRSRRWKETFRP